MKKVVTKILLFVLFKQQKKLPKVQISLLKP